MNIKKKPRANTEKVRSSLVILGFFIVISLVTLSFSYKVPVGIKSTNNGLQTKDDIPEEFIVIEEEIKDEKDVIEEPIVNDVDTPILDDDIQLIKNDDKDEIIIIDLPPIDDDADDTPAPPAPIYDYPDKEASFPGGAVELKKFLSDNVVFPKESQRWGEEGKVYIEFIVNQDGSIEQAKIARGVSKEIDKEAIRVINLMPNWIPGETGGEKVRTKCRIPLNFKLR